MPRASKQRQASTAIRGKVRAHDPFELIRWLAMSQPDPRKALAELVQNSLDAGARQVRIIRARMRGKPSIRIVDDGEGVLPDLDRTEALRYIATHIGHSRKRDLTPQERMQLMTQGQYGIGLLGFWCMGEHLQMRSAVPDQSPMTLSLQRDSAAFEIDIARGHLHLEDRWTEILITDVHKEVVAMLSGRRIAEYLAAELRGQLLARDVELVIEDQMSRGRSPKLLAVRPPRFLGERIADLTVIELKDYPPIHLEIYLTDEDNAAQKLSVYAAGTLVAEDFNELSNLNLDGPPWTDGRLCGLVDFAGFQVSPGSRRRVIADAAASAFAAGLGQIVPQLEQHLQARENERATRVDVNLVRDLKRVFRDFFGQRPGFSMLPVADKGLEVSVMDDQHGRSGTLLDPLGDDAGAPSEPAESESISKIAEQSGPLYALAITPTPLRVERLGQRQVRARPIDNTGRVIKASVSYEWLLDETLGRLSSESAHGATATIVAGETLASGNLSVLATQDGHTVRADRLVEVVEALEPARMAAGLPSPEFVHEPGLAWRSRLIDERWQVNTGHRDYRDVAERPGLKLRYVAMLFAKEIVVRSNNDPRLSAPLEQLIEVASYADRHTGPTRQNGRRKTTE
jgi:hypothetical protein